MSYTTDVYSTFYNLKKVNEKPPIVFIHGVGLNSEIWNSQINFFKNYNILTYDLIGHGNTPLDKKQLRFDDFSKQLLNLINELNFNKFHLVGFSLGALIARNFASKHNNRLSSLILHASIYKRTEDQKRVVRNRFELIKTDKPAFKIAALRRWFTEDFITKNPEVYNKIYSILEQNDLKKILKSYKLFVYYEDDDDILKQIKVDTLITTGQNDVGSTIEMAKNLNKQIQNSEFIEIKNGKHLCNIECDEYFNKVLEKFIDMNNDKD